MDFMRQHILALSLISCALYTGMVYNRVQPNKISVTRKDVTQKPLSNEEQQKINIALEKAITYSHDVGVWLEDLFDAENNIPYADHVQELKKIVVNIEKDFVMPLQPNENTHTALIVTYQFALLLLQRIEHTYAVLESYCGSNYPFVHVGLGMALKKVLNSSRDKAGFDEILQDLHMQLEVLAPALDTKLHDLKGTIKLYSDRLNTKNWRTLTNGLWHRLSC